MTASEVKLNRAFTNNVFSSWRLGSGPPASLVENIPLPGCVRRKEQESYDYLHTRLALLANQVYQDGEVLYTFLTDSDDLNLYRYSSSLGFYRLAAIGTPEQVTAPGVVAVPDIECSVAAVQIPDDEHQGSKAPKLFIASNGHGDMVMIAEAGESTVVSVSVNSARIALQPFIVEAAYHVLPGVLRVVLWSIKEKTNEHPASCQLHLATVAYDLKARVAHLEALHPLGQSKLPPHAVVVSAKDDAVAMAYDPADPHAPAGSNPGLGANGLPDDAAMDSDDDVPSPRTLRAAADRLAQYTSEAQEPASGPVSNVFSDLYSEASPADEATTLEPECVVHYFSCRPAAGIEPSTTSKDDVQLHAAAAAVEAAEASPQQEALNAQPRLVKEVSCSSYKLLTSQASGIERNSALLGLIDDVDTAVVCLACSSAESTPLTLEHVASVPAFAYVATGKTQRKFVLLGNSGQKVAAVIVEANKFAFIYYAVPSDFPNGTHQVLDLGLAKNENVIGAALQAGLHDNSATRLVIMTESSLKVFDVL